MAEPTNLQQNHTVQLNWLNKKINQLGSPNDKGDIFIKSKAAIGAYYALGLLPDDADVERFVSEHLTKSGLVKLKTTLRIYKKRQVDKTIVNRKKLDVSIPESSMSKLNRLVKRTGKTKIELITDMIEAYKEPDDLTD